MSITTILLSMQKVVTNPQTAIKEHRQATGHGAIGCFPEYVPEEIIHAAGLLPIGMWGGQTQIEQAHTVLPAFVCPLIQANVEFAFRGVYNDLAAIIIPAPCDTLKSIGQDWLYILPSVKAIILVYPQMRKIDAGITYLASEFAYVREQIETITGHKITDIALEHSIEVYNKHRQTMRNFTKIAPLYPNTITPAVRHLVIKSAYFMEKSQHTALVEELLIKLQQLPAEQWQGKRIILTGIIAEPDGLLDIFAENGLAVVGDDLAHESRQFRTDVPTGEDPLTRLAKQWSLVEGCSLAYDPDKKRGDMLIELARKYNADGIILCMMKFCDPEEFDYPILFKQLTAANIPLLYLDIDQQNQSLEQYRTRIQGFAEILETI